jgi:hypothetical protein
MKEFTMNKELEINGNTVSVGEEKRYKYILNGETFYYTKDELREYIRTVHEKNDEPLSAKTLEFLLERRIKLLEENDGDLFLNLKGIPEVYEIAHKAAAMGIIAKIH